MTRSTLRAIGAAVLCATLAACGGETMSTVSTVAATAATSTQLTVRGTVSGLLGQDLELTLNGAIPIAASGNGSFQYSATVPVGTTVSVAVTRQPVAPAQVCRAATPTRAADGAWVVGVDCDAPPSGTAGALTGTLAVKQLTLSWSAAADATSYQVQRRTGDGTWIDDGQPIAAPAISTVRALSVHLVDWVTARYRVAVCNARGCNATTTELSVLDTIAGAIGYLKASNTDAGDRFGAAIAMSTDGSTLAVAAVEEDGNGTGATGNPADNTVANAGAVYVYLRGATGWTQQAYLKASNPGAGDGFGVALSLSANGSTLAVGAPGEDSSATGVIATAPSVNNSAANAGAAYVFGRSGTTWTQQAYVKASNTDAGDEFGRSLALSGDGGTLAVGAPNESSAATGVNGNASDNSVAASGAVYVFVRPAASWSQQAYLKASNTGADDLLGQSLALSQDGNTLAVGAPFEDSGGAPSDDTVSGSGAVYVFVRSGVTWSQQAYLKATAAFSGDAFGTSVALAADGNTLAIGAPLGDGSTPGTGNPTTRGVVDTGAVTVFVRGGATWAARSYLQASHIDASDQFGMTVALSGDGTLLAVGAPLDDSAATGYGGDATNASAPDAGGVFLY